jgi:hypothetical protein
MRQFRGTQAEVAAQADCSTLSLIHDTPTGAPHPQRFRFIPGLLAGVAVKNEPSTWWPTDAIISDVLYENTALTVMPPDSDGPERNNPFFQNERSIFRDCQSHVCSRGSSTEGISFGEKNDFTDKVPILRLRSSFRGVSTNTTECTTENAERAFINEYAQPSPAQ